MQPFKPLENRRNTNSFPPPPMNNETAVEESQNSPELFDESLECYIPAGEEPFTEHDDEEQNDDRPELLLLSSPKPTKSVKIEFTTDEVKLGYTLAQDVPDVVSAVGANMMMNASGMFRGYQRIDNRKTVFADICEPAYELMLKYPAAFIDSVFGKSFLESYEIYDMKASPADLSVPVVYIPDGTVPHWEPEAEVAKERAFFPGRQVDITVELDWDDPYVYRAETGEKGHYEELDMRDVLLETIFSCLSRAKDGVKQVKPVVTFEGNLINIQDKISYASYWDFLNDYEKTANTVFGEDFKKVYGISSLSVVASKPVFSSPATDVDYMPPSLSTDDSNSGIQD